MARHFAAGLIIVVLVLAGVASPVAGKAFYRLPCSATEEYRLSDARDYRGTVARTVSGLRCQPWAATMPHRHSTPIDPSLGTAGEGNNYCRNPLPSAHSSAWCFTLSPTVPYERCDVGPVCNPGAAAQVEPVTITPTSARQAAPLTVTLACATVGADVFYTLDGSTPSPTSGTPYTGPFVLSTPGAVTVRAVALKDYMRASDVLAHTFAVTPAAVPSPTISPTPTDVRFVYDRPVLVSITAPADIDGVQVYYSATGSMPAVTDESLYTGPFWVRESTTVRAIAVARGRSPSLVAEMPYNVIAPAAPAPTVRPSVPLDSTIYGTVLFELSSAVAGPEFAVRVNNSELLSLSAAQRLLAPGVQPADSVLVIDRPGTHSVSVSVAGRGTGFSPAVEVRLTIVPMPTVALLPAPGTYNGPVRVSASIATGDTSTPIPIVVRLNGERVENGALLSAVGTYEVEAFAQGYGSRSVVATATYVLEPLRLSMPSVSPDPAAFPVGFTFVSPLVLSLPRSDVAGVSYELTVNSQAVGAAQTQLVSADTSSTFELPSAISSEQVVVLVVRAVASNASNPFLLASAAARFEFRVAPFGTEATPFFLVDPAVDPTASNCAGVQRAISRALSLSDANLGVGARVVVHSCARRPAFRVAGLPASAVEGYVRFIIADLVDQSTSRIYAALGGANTASSTRVGVDWPLFPKGCAAVSAATYFPAAESGDSTVEQVSPLQCATRCAATAGIDAASILMADGGRCACLASVQAPGAALASSRCDRVCAMDASMTCGGRDASSTAAISTHYGLINVSAGSNSALFPIVYGFSRTTSGVISTTSPFTLRLSSANLPNAGGLVKFVLAEQTCASIAQEHSLDVDGTVGPVLLRRAGTYRVCVSLPTSAGSDDAGVFRELPSLAGTNDNTLQITAGADVPVLVTPDSGVVASPLTLTVSCSAVGAKLHITVDQEAPIVVDGPSFTFVLRTLGSHLVSAHATTGSSAVGLPVTRAFTVVDPSRTTVAPPPDATTAVVAANQIGVRGYAFQVTEARRAEVRLSLNAAKWRDSACGDITATTPCSLFVPRDGTPCSAGPTASVASSAVMIADGDGDEELSAEAVTPLSLEGLTFSRAAVPVCLQVPGVGSLAVAPLEPRWQLTSASVGVGRCSVGQAAMCAAESRCSARVRDGTFEGVCLCDAPNAADRAETASSEPVVQSLFCTKLEAVPAELRRANSWNGTIFPLATEEPSNGEGKDLAVPEVQGSWVSLFALTMLFALSTAILCYVKRRQHTSAAGMN